MENPQSLMHLQSSRGEGGGFQIKKPCCSPAAYRPLDILHLDQVAYPSISGISIHSYQANLLGILLSTKDNYQSTK